MNVLIAGATGQTGTRLAHELLSRGHHPIALLRDKVDPGATAARGDVAALLTDAVEEPQWEGRSWLMQSR